MININLDIEEIPDLFCHVCGAKLHKFPVDVSNIKYKLSSGKPFVRFSVKHTCPNKKWWFDKHYSSKMYVTVWGDAWVKRFEQTL